MLSIIVAYDQNRGIGYENDLPWTPISEDWKHFKRTTLGKTVIMGRRTWESLPKKPLPGRANVVVSTTIQPQDEGAAVYCNLEDALKNSRDESFIIGGGQLYRYALDQNLVDRVIASELYDSYKADTFFPELEKGWEMNILQQEDKFRIVEYKK